MNFLELRKEFNEAFNIKSNKDFGLIPAKDSALEFNMLHEELVEYLTACINHDEVEVMDAIIDMMYLIYGIAYRHGMTNETLEKAFKEVHASNMSKLGEDGKPIYREDGKVMKSDKFFKPNLKQFI